MNLLPAAASLQQLPAEQDADLQQQEKRLARFGSVTFGAFGLVVLAAICMFAYLIITKMILSGTKPIPGILALLVIVFGSLSLAYVYWKETLNEKRKKLESAPNRVESSNVKPNLLTDTYFEPAHSVVEDPTELLHTRHDTNKL